MSAEEFQAALQGQQQRLDLLERTKELEKQLEKSQEDVQALRAGNDLLRKKVDDKAAHPTGRKAIPRKPKGKGVFTLVRLLPLLYWRVVCCLRAAAVPPLEEDIQDDSVEEIDFQQDEEEESEEEEQPPRKKVKKKKKNWLAESDWLATGEEERRLLCDHQEDQRRWAGQQAQQGIPPEGVRLL